MICKAKGINSSYSILPSAFMSACHQLRLGRCNFGLEAVATSQQSAFTCMNLEKSSREVPSSQFFCKCPEDSTNLKPLADNQFHWFNVDYKYIEHIISTYSYIPSYQTSPANSRLIEYINLTSSFSLKNTPCTSARKSRISSFGKSRRCCKSCIKALNSIGSKNWLESCRAVLKDLDLKKS